MKLTKIALSLVFLTGAAITGGSWYTGKQVEEKYQELVAQGNQALSQLKFYGVDAQIKEVKLDRGFFSSAVKYQLEAKTTAGTFVFDGNDQLFHGPLPLNRLKQMNFAPAMASLQSELSVPESLKAMFEDKAVLSGQAAISYAGNVEGVLKTNPYKSPEGVWQVGAGEINYHLDKERKGKLIASLKSIAMGDKASNLMWEIVEPKYTFSITDKNDQYSLLYSGDMEFEAKSYEMKPFNKEEAESDFIISVNNTKMKGYSKLNGTRYESGGDFSGEMQMKKDSKAFSFGKLSSDMFFDVDAKSLEAFMQFIQKPDLLEIVAQGEELPEAQQEELGKIFMDLITKSPKMHIKSFSLENAKGKGSIDFILNLAEFDAGSLNDFDKVLNIFKQSVIGVDVNKPFIEELTKTFEELSGENAEQAATNAKEITEQIVAQAKSTEGFVFDNDKIKLKVELSEGKIKLNEKEMSEAEVQSVLFMLMMSLGGMGL